MTQTRKRNYALRENGIKQVSALLANPYLSEEEEFKHAAERRAQYVPKFVIEKKARWMRREKSLFPGLVR
ncbi:hypothetical protein EMCRGX_G009025 [Ephydatia muelleri]